MSIRKQMELIENVCRSNQCAAKVKLASIKTDNKSLAFEAIAQLRQRDGFRKYFLSNPWSISTLALSAKKDFWEVNFNYSYRPVSNDA